MSQIHEHSNTKLVDDLREAYAEWREQCLEVHEAYRYWQTAPCQCSSAYGAYCEALDKEETAADIYKDVLSLVTGQQSTFDDSTYGGLHWPAQDD